MDEKNENKNVEGSQIAEQVEEKSAAERRLEEEHRLSREKSDKREIKSVIDKIHCFTKYGSPERVKVKDERGEYRFIKDEFIEDIVTMFMLEDFEARGLNKLDDDGERLKGIQKIVESVSVGLDNDGHQFESLYQKDKHLDRKAFYSGVVLKNMVGKYGSIGGSSGFWSRPEQFDASKDYNETEKAVATFIEKHIKTINLLVSYARGLGENMKLVMDGMGDITKSKDFIPVLNSYDLEVSKEGVILQEGMNDKQKKEIESLFSANLEKATKDSLLINENLHKEKSEKLANILEKIEKLTKALDRYKEIMRKRQREFQDLKPEKIGQEVATLNSRIEEAEVRIKAQESEIADLQSGLISRIFNLGKIGEKNRIITDIRDSIRVMGQRKDYLNILTSDLAEIESIKKEFGDDYKMEHALDGLNRDKEQT